MRMLCATDLSSRSDRAMRRAAMLARQAGAELLLLSVVDDDQPPGLVSNERRDVLRLLSEQASDMAEIAGLEPRIRVEAGDAFDAIIRVAAQEAVDVVVMGEHRKRLLLDMFVGTTIERVMRRGHAPVLMVNRPPLPPYERVLVAMDMSGHSSHALRVAFGLGFAEHAELTVLHAFQQPGRSSMVLAGLSNAAIAQHVAATAAEKRREITAFLQALELDFGPRFPLISVLEGNPIEALREAVEGLSPDLLVIGTRGHGALGRLVLGSVAEEALRTLDCDILAVPPQAE